MERMTGAKAVVEVLKNAGVKLVVGYIGHGVHEYADVLMDTPGIKSIYSRTEGTGVTIADGYNRIAGRPEAVCIFHPNGMVSALYQTAEAWFDSVPLVLISGNVHSAHKGRGALQETPVAEIFRPFTKWAYRVERGDMLPFALEHAFKVAGSGRPRPVLVEIPYDLSVEEQEVQITPPEKLKQMIGRVYGPEREQIRKAAQLLVEAKKPAILAGGGVAISGASEPLMELATLLGAPVATSAMGKGCIPDDHELAVGVAGVTGWKNANDILKEKADVVLVIGYRFAEWGLAQQYFYWKPKFKMIHADIDPEEIGRNFPVDLGIVGDAKSILQELIEEIKKTSSKKDYHSNDWFKECSHDKEVFVANLTERMTSSQSPSSPYRIIHDIREVAGRDAIIVTDCGNNQAFSIASSLTYKPKTFLTPGGYGELGFSFPAALGAKLASPKCSVVAITGDGGFHYSFHELGLAAKENIAVVVCVFNDGYLNANRQLQRRSYQGRECWVELNNPDFVKLAESFGIKGTKVENPSELKPMLSKALATNEPYVLDIKIDDMVLGPQHYAGSTMNFRNWPPHPSPADMEPFW